VFFSLPGSYTSLRDNLPSLREGNETQPRAAAQPSPRTAGWREEIVSSLPASLSVPEVPRRGSNCTTPAPIAQMAQVARRAPASMTDAYASQRATSLTGGLYGR
jgi:hypothetical protein